MIRLITCLPCMISVYLDNEDQAKRLSLHQPLRIDDIHNLTRIVHAGQVECLCVESKDTSENLQLANILKSSSLDVKDYSKAGGKCKTHVTEFSNFHNVITETYETMQEGVVLFLLCNVMLYYDLKLMVCVLVLLNFFYLID